MSTSILRERSRTVSKLLYNLILTRQMGGGPRTFPGGVSKWKWKRMHEKRAKDKEKRLLEQEKQLYQARIRSQIRSKLSGQPDPFPEPASSEGPGPMSPNDHIKALADRFMKEGAEDLWNERDGPVKSPPSSTARLNQRSRSISEQPPIDLRKLIPEQDKSVNLSNLNGNYLRARNYSVQRRNRRNESSSSEEEEDDDGDDLGSVSKGDFMKPILQSSVGNRESSNFAKKVDDFSMDKKFSAKKQRRLWRNGSSSTDDDTELDSEEESGKSFGRDLRKMGSSASLGKYDFKIKKRVPLNSCEKEIDFAEQVELIRHQLRRKNLIENEEEKEEEEEEVESILSDKRYCTVVSEIFSFWFEDLDCGYN